MTNSNQILFYQAPDGETRIEVLHEDETVWLTQKEMVALFQRDKSVISRHIKNIFDEGELIENSVVAKNATTAPDGKKYDVSYYNLDVIISVGYRVKSLRGTQFRIWATKKLRDFIVKGYVMDDDRLANGGSNYFDELIERVRHIRTSEYNFYRKVREIFATSIDYNGSTPDAKKFFATVQNKFHYAIHGYTAAELVVARIGSEKLNFGLTNWRGKVVTLKDALIAKNYLEELEIKRLELLVEQFLSFAELQSLEQKPMYMQDWIKKLDGFIILNEKKVLSNSGAVSKSQKEKKVRKAFETYKENLIAQEALSEDEWQRKLEDAALNMLPPAPDDEIFTQDDFYEGLKQVSKADDED